MKIKIYLMILIVIGLSFSTYAQNLNILRIENGKNKFKGKLTTDQFAKFKVFIEITSEFKLVDGNNFIINYKQPFTDCFYNQYENDENSSIKWLEKNVYSGIDIKFPTLNLFYQSKAIVDKKSKIKFDLTNFIYNNFMRHNELCFGLLIVNSLGEYRLLIGEYTSKDVSKFEEELKIN
ncbi:MAG: hypothetical protein ABI549_07135 [Flavobacterium sp.]|uniref:hypothetical protein n=1 Tax=Flavobacterium sp. TaxID=239 RepID=UPI0032656B29